MFSIKVFFRKFLYIAKLISPPYSSLQKNTGDMQCQYVCLCDKILLTFLRSLICGTICRPNQFTLQNDNHSLALQLFSIIHLWYYLNECINILSKFTHIPICKQIG